MQTLSRNRVVGEPRMINLTLLVKASNPSHLQKIEDMLQGQFEDLDVKLTLKTGEAKWVQATLNGEDEVIASNFVKKKIGVAPENLKQIEPSTVLKGFISKVDPNQQQIRVDVGVFAPKPIQAIIPQATLQNQLGKKVDLQKMAQAYGFFEDVPLNVRVVEVAETGLVAELAEAQIETFSLWQQSLLDRLMVLRVSSEELEGVLERAHLYRDVIGVEELGLFEHVLTCKLGTDAAGLIPKVGRYLRNARFVIFSPVRNLQII
jgi:hypothetical protein